MRFFGKRRTRQSASSPRALVAVVNQALPAGTAEEQQWADQFQRLYPVLYGLTRVPLGHDAARDVIQDVFLSFWSVRDQLAPEDRSDAAMTVAVKNRMIDVIRRDGRTQA